MLAMGDGPALDSNSPTATTTLIGRVAPRIMRVAEPYPSSWTTAVEQAATLGFDTVLLPTGPLPRAVADAARAHGAALMNDVFIDRVMASDLDGVAPFARIHAPNIDPRTPPSPAAIAPAALGTLDDAAALAAWWGPRIMALRDAGSTGVRLLGLRSLPGWAVAPFLVALRGACPGVVLFGWTPGLPWPALDALPPGTLDLVASSLPWWDGAAAWFWRELDMLRSVAPVVCDAGGHTARHPLAALLGDGVMATADVPGAAMVNAAKRDHLSGLPYVQVVSPPGNGAVAVLRTDTPDPRRAHHGAVCLTAIRPGARLAASDVLGELGADYGPFSAVTEGAAPLQPGTVLSPDPGSVAVYLASTRQVPVVLPLSREAAAAAGAVPRVAIEAPAPAVDGGRFPARLVVGSSVTVTADVLTDGHDKLGVALRWRPPTPHGTPQGTSQGTPQGTSDSGHGAWTEVTMRLTVNDVWTADFPLERLGMHHYVVEAWRDLYATFADELEKKHRAGLGLALELREGEALLIAASETARESVAEGLLALQAQFQASGPDAQRELLLAETTRDLMRKADPRPHRATTAEMPVQAERTAAGFASWYEVFPRSMSDDPGRHGTFRDVVRHLPRVARMGFDVLYFPPFHPIGAKNRKGRNNTLTPAPDDPGSPYAIGSSEGGHDALHPELGSIEDLQHLFAAAAQHGIELAMDFAIQCSPDHPWLEQHKRWFTWRPDGTIRYAENPPKRYEDIVNVDFYAPDAVPGLWLALAEAVMFWAGQGIRLFRVDNPHTKPLPFWEWMIAEVQARYPDAVFLAEAFTRPKVMYRLAKVGFSQSYTYFTWRSQKWEFEQYLQELTQGPPRDFFRPHFFVNTPDINPVPLQTAPRSGFLTRAALAATLSGLWGVYCGFELCEATPVPGKEEYLDSEKYQIRKWDWGRPGNIEHEIGLLNAIRRANPALHTHLGVTFLKADNEQVLLFEKATADRSNVVLVAVNLDLRTPQSAWCEVPFWRWRVSGFPEPGALHATDLVTDRTERWTDQYRHATLTSDQPYAIWRITPAEA